MKPEKVNFTLYQGSTFQETLRWESDNKVYIPITQITKSAPVTVTANNYGLVPNWRYRITNVIGMKEINCIDKSTFYIADIITPNTVITNKINSIDFSSYQSGGILEYNEPINLAGYTARMQIRPNISSNTVIEELTTQNGKIQLNNDIKTITLTIPAGTTMNYNFLNAVYSLELITGDTVIPFIYGNVSLQKEVTR